MINPPFAMKKLKIILKFPKKLISIKYGFYIQNSKSTSYILIFRNFKKSDIHRPNRNDELQSENFEYIIHHLNLLKEFNIKN